MLNFMYKFDDFATLSTEYSKALRQVGTAEAFAKTLTKWLGLNKRELHKEVENLLASQASNINSTAISMTFSSSIRQPPEIENAETTEEETAPSGTIKILRTQSLIKVCKAIRRFLKIFFQSNMFTKEMSKNFPGLKNSNRISRQSTQNLSKWVQIARFCWFCARFARISVSIAICGNDCKPTIDFKTIYDRWWKIP